MGRIRIVSKIYGTHYVLVDDEDLELVSRYKWHLNKKVRKTSGDILYYAETNIKREDGSRSSVRMHRLILGLDFGDKRIADHINYRTLDNRRCNLRICSPLESVRHRKKVAGTSSKYKGVHYNPKNKNWVSQIQIKGKQRGLGSFKTQKEAAVQYDIAAFAEFGEFAELNFPRIDHYIDDFDIENFKTPAQKRKTSKFVGVCWHKGNRAWDSQIMVNEKTIYLGLFKNEEDAAKAYNNYVIKHRLNRKLNTFLGE